MLNGNGDRSRRGGVQAIEVGGRLLEQLVRHGAPMTLKALAASANMPAAKAHRYLTSLAELGLVEQQRGTGKYGLGAMAVRLGLAAIGQNDVVDRSSALLAELCEELSVSGHISIWSERGPVVIRTAHGGPPVISPIGVGSILPLLDSATGQVFNAYLPPVATARLTEAQPARREGPPLADPIADGFALAVGNYMPGLNAIAFPSFGYDDALVCSMTFIHTDVSLFTRDSAATRRLRDRIEAERRRWRIA